MYQGPPLNRKLSELGNAQVSFDCGLCARHGRTTAPKLLKQFGDILLSELLLKFAEARGCPRAEALEPNEPTPIGGHCRIRCDYQEPVTVKAYTMLGTAHDEGWGLSLVCDSHRAGMKSRRPCMMTPVSVDVRTLVMVLGPMTHIERLDGILRCPKCGRNGVILYWSMPGGGAASKRA